MPVVEWTSRHESRVAGTPREAVKAVRREFPHATIQSVDELDFLGFCDGCSEPILEGDAHRYCEDAHLCGACFASLEDPA